MASIAEQLNDDQRAELLGEKSVEKAIDLTVQQRVARAAAAAPAVWWFTQASDWEIAPWWSPIRDVDLRNFVRKEGNDILQGAVSSMVKKFRAMNWVVDGPAATVKWAQELLGEAEFGKGWSSLVGKTIEDYLVTDNGAFWEIIGKGRPDKPLKGLPEGVAHLDSCKCTLTGDPEFPVVFRSGKGATAHKMHATRVVHMVDMESPNEDMNGVGFCACSRVVASSQLLLLLSKYKREKLSDLPQAGLLVLNNIVPSKWEEAKAEYERERRVLGNELWANIMTLVGVDPAQQASADFISFSNLPDHFDEAGTITTYVNVVALAMGLDAREFWPVSSGALGTSAESLVMHQKAKGKGIGDLISTIERAINWHLFPSRVSFAFDFQDDEEDAAKAQIEDQKARTIVSMYTAVDAAGQSLASREEARQMLADNVGYFLPEFLAVDLTGEQEGVDTEAEPEGETAGDQEAEDVDRDEGQEEEGEGEKYSPDQPRVPAGDPEGGQWTSGEGSRPTWASDEGQEVDGFTVYRGRWGAAKNSYAVLTEEGSPSNWRDTPKEAVADYRKLLRERDEARARDRVYQASLDKVRGGDYGEWRRLTGGQNLSTSQSIGLLRDLGLRDKDAKAIVSRLGIVGESRYGTLYRDSEELLERYRSFQERQKSLLDKVKELWPGT